MFFNFGPNKIEGAREAIKNPNVLVLDVRSKVEYEQSHLDGAINVEFSEIQSSKKLPRNKSSQIAVYCAGGSRSKVAANTLKKMGYTDVTNLGGLVGKFDTINA